MDGVSPRRHVSARSQELDAPGGATQARLAVVLVLVLAGLMYGRVGWGVVAPSPASAGTYAEGDIADHLWCLWWPVAVARGQMPGTLYYAPALYAAAGGASLALDSYSPLDGWLAAPFVWADSSFVGLARAYNWTIVLHAAALGVGTFLLAWRVTASVLAGAAAALYAVLFPYFLVLSYQLSVSTFAWVPWLLLAMYEAHARRNWRWSVLAGLSVALVGYAYSEYLLHVFPCVASLWLASLVRPAAGTRRATLVQQMSLIVAVGAVALVPLWLGLLQGLASGPLEIVPRQQRLVLSTDVLSLLLPSERHTLLGWVAPTLKMRADAFVRTNDSFLGYASLIFAALGVRAVWARTRWVPLWAVLYLLLALGPVVQVLRHPLPGVPGPYALLAAVVPGYALHRVPRRLMGLALPFLAVLVGAGVARVAVALRTRDAPQWCALVPLFLIAGELWREPPSPIPVYHLPPAYTALAAQPPGTLLNLPRASWTMECAYMAVQTQTHRPIAGGAISRLPAGQRHIPPDAGPIRYVALHRAYYSSFPPETYRDVERRLDALGAVVADDGDVRLYRLPGAGRRAGELPRLPLAPYPWPTDAQVERRLMRVREARD